jgi:hypothetical protein
MSGKRLDPQQQHDVAPSARERAADKTADTARTENRMSHVHDRKHRNIDATPRDAVHRRRSSDDPLGANLDAVAFADSSPALAPGAALSVALPRPAGVGNAKRTEQSLTSTARAPLTARLPPEEAPAREQFRDRLTAEVHLGAAAIVADLADGRALPRHGSRASVRRCAGGRRLARVAHRLQGRICAGPGLLLAPRGVRCADDLGRRKQKSSAPLYGQPASRRALHFRWRWLGTRSGTCVS